MCSEWSTRIAGFLRLCKVQGAAVNNTYQTVCLSDTLSSILGFEDNFGNACSVLAHRETWRWTY